MLNEKISTGADGQSEAPTDCNQHLDENRVLVVDHTQNGIKDTLVTSKKTSALARLSVQRRKSNGL